MQEEDGAIFSSYSQGQESTSAQVFWDALGLKASAQAWEWLSRWVDAVEVLDLFPAIRALTAKKFEGIWTALLHLPLAPLWDEVVMQQRLPALYQAHLLLWNLQGISARIAEQKPGESSHEAAAASKIKGFE